jgi:hypothetical protein
LVSYSISIVNKEKGISENQKQGSVGESLVEAKLKRFAQVSHPANLLDYTIDFFCALYDGNKPSNVRFNIQVKTGRSIGEYWSEPIEREKVEFWLEQAFPVYIILADEETEECYWLSVEDNREKWIKRLLSGKKTLTITVDARKRFIQREFIEKILSDTIRVKASQGIPVFVSKGYTGTIPIMKLSEASRTNINQTVRLGLDYLIYDRLVNNDLYGAYAKGTILTAFDRSHYDHFLLMARICQQLGKTSEALGNYNEAILICKSDPNWNKRKSPDDPLIEEIILAIEEEKSKLWKLLIDPYHKSSP